MNIEAREGTPGDIEEIIALFEGKDQFLSMMWSSMGDEVKSFHVRSLRSRAHLIGQGGDFKVFVAERSGDRKAVAYLVLFLDIVETITGEKQGFIFDYAVSPDHAGGDALPLLFRKAEEAVREREIQYLVMEIFAQDKEGEKRAFREGFGKEMNRIILRTAVKPLPRHDPDPFIVRKAQSEDLFFVLWLNTQCASFTIPSGRDRPKDDVQYRYLRIYSELSLEESEDFTALIIEDAVKETPVGYLLFKTNACDAITGARLGYVYDIAIHPDYWGKRAAQRLMKEGINLLSEKGIPFCLADISEGNQRALKTAIKSIGFHLESIRWMKKLGVIESASGA
ncbi:MAG: GNAT family N-acetyltransferase [Candidatus Eremiobacteraeota bacterium]|nr:GNAT family N-acetyltransferase [Candidatus Eremiobacteraeota bacterium]